MIDIWAYLSGLNSGLMVGCLIMGLSLFALMLPKENRAYFDPVPPILKPIWPLVRLVAYFIATNLPETYLAKIDEKLQKTGACYILTAEEFFAVTFLTTIGLPLLGAIAFAGTGNINLAILILLGAMGFVLPEMWILDGRKKRDRDLIKNLPVFLEYLVMCVDAGLNFSGALKQAVDKGPKSAMKNEFRIVLRDISSGLTRADALTRMEQRVDLKDISVFVRAVIQAEKMGSSMKETLSVQAQQRLDERFQRAEKLAMEAPVKLIVPLIIFIFPLTFAILAFPIVMKFMDQGAL